MRRSLPRKPPPAKKGKRPVKPPAAKKEPEEEESKVLKAATKAEKTLQQIKEDEAKERTRVIGETEQKISDGQVAWLQYLRPCDVTSPEECAKMDEFNYSVFQHNNAMLPRVNVLMKAVGRPAQRVEAAPKYLAISKAKMEKMLFNEEFRVLKGVEFLARRGVYPIKDYPEMIEAAGIADDLAEKEEIARIIRVSEEDVEGNGFVDISAAVGSTHKSNCTCENSWDGTSERCVGKAVRLRWRRLKDHHFLRPRIIPEKY
jgi:hypothetical protein